MNLINLIEECQTDWLGGWLNSLRTLGPQLMVIERLMEQVEVI